MTEWIRNPTAKGFSRDVLEDPYELAPTGRDLDALVAEKVMGIAPMDVRVCGEVDTPPVRIWNASPYWRQDGRHDRYQLTMNADAPPYSTSIADAWLVVEKLKDAATAWTLANYGNEWHVKVKRVNEYGKKVFYGESAERELPLAICRAALAAVDVASACREDGWRAGADGRKKTDNPHTPNSPQWVAWDHGWKCWSSEYGLNNA